ncbi:DUF1834 family protein [Pandoraea apista]|uniref:DUF1834 family protein n=1 Tax=Pandoraea apista TaxID=93218 RepID=UPI000F683CEB|nr:DUF1834 family protein [Pandoraea apista]RRW90596.1 DUF1834 family protein [Pandoraea apista]RRX00388.1 DUF1834 family protein [Pandoraea apista]
MTTPATGTYVPIITAVELAMVDRLTRGLGRMVNEVKTYGGEFDDEELSQVVTRFPAAWVTFGGVSRTDAESTSRTKYKAEALFVVMVGAISVRSEASSRHGGPDPREIGSNLLISCVRKLLNQQDMGLPIRALVPGAIRTLFNTKTRDNAFSVYALEFRTAWMESSLFLGAFPEEGSTTPMDEVFARYGGQLDPPEPDWQATLLRYFTRPGEQVEPVATDRVVMKNEDKS